MGIDAQPIQTAAAAAAIGPYSQAIRSGDLLFVSGQIPLDPLTGEVVSQADDVVAEQTHRVLQNLRAILDAAGGSLADAKSQGDRVLQNLRAILDAAGGSLADVVKTTVFVVDLADFAAINEIYATYFEVPAPARTTVQVAALPKGVRLEIDAIAVLSS